MDENEQRIAIAEWVGLDPRIKKYVMDGEGPSGGGYYHWDIPNYLYDLNDMHDAENRIEQYDQFVKHLSVAVGGAGTIGNMVHATAKQRAEALLKTIGKWKD